MFEILDDIRVLASSALDLYELSLDQVAFGARGSAIPRDRIVDVSGSPLVTTAQEGAGVMPTYFDSVGREIPLGPVIDSIINAHGTVHFANKLSFKLVGGLVVGFAIYGPHLDAFGTLDTADAVVATFGAPDRSRENVTHGDLMGHDFYYAASRKQVSWDASDRRIRLVNLGDYPRDF